MNSKWRLGDLIDLEYFLRADENRDDEIPERARDERDRDIYVRSVLPRIAEGEATGRSFVLKAWLDERRRSEKAGVPSDAASPGEALEEILRLLKSVFLIAGLVTGGGAAFSFLVYRGEFPVNVFLYLYTFVFSQAFLYVFLSGRFLASALARKRPARSILYSLMSRLVVRLALRVKKRGLASLSGSRRESLAAALGTARAGGEVYGPVFFWPVFIIAQLFGVGFNAGVLAATLLRVLTTDLAFGWQSTLRLSAQAVHGVAKWIALPWSWFLPPEIAHPSLGQIEGSRMILKDGIMHLATGDLVSWWPFLCLAVFFWGAAPRLIMLAAGLAFQARALKRIPFSHGACERLLHRMESPRVRSAGIPASAPPGETAWPIGEAGAETTKPERVSGLGAIIALIPVDISEACAEPELGAVVSAMLGGHVRERILIGRDYEGDRVVLRRLREREWEEGRPSLLVIQEAWQPPLNEHLLFIEELRDIMGRTTPIVIGLVGRPSPRTIFTGVKPADWDIWKRKLAALGDPWLRAERLASHDD